ncbi:hypothetical protein ACPPVU_14855 [Mucilaginibacter sp. McL0603]|uniref:hypothetical protein n=1 Tax=Mucilaginibacter sp. McL0603 TaxID=3415670 RepID=UPI003CFA5FE5
MKPPLPVLFILACLVCFCGCSRTIHTQQVLQSPHTKDDVLKQFGPPDERKQGDGIEEWVYTRYPVSASKKQDAINSQRENSSADSLKINPTGPNNKYFKFIIDTNNNVVGYKNNGVDLTKKVKQNPAVATLKFLGQLVIVTIIIGLYLGVEDYITF